MSTIFSLILVAVTLLSGLVWLVDSLVFAKRRRLHVVDVVTAAGGHISDQDAKTAAAPAEPWLVETSRSIFPVIAFVLVLRSFLWEPFQIPSGSMMPTLLVGDFLLVEKFSYGIKDPVFRKTLIETGKPERGDVAVFKFPKQPNVDYIKRVIGLPGDTITYRNKMLTIVPKCAQGTEPADQAGCEVITVPHSEPLASEYQFGRFTAEQMTADLAGVEHQILHIPQSPQQTSRYYRQIGLPANTWVVPEGHYFMVGDNRDGSADSRFWGFVDEQLLVGRASVIWMSFTFDKSGDGFLPSWFPTGVRLGRIGGIR